MGQVRTCGKVCNVPKLFVNRVTRIASNRTTNNSTVVRAAASSQAAERQSSTPSTSAREDAPQPQRRTWVSKVASSVRQRQRAARKDIKRLEEQLFSSSNRGVSTHDQFLLERMVERARVKQDHVEELDLTKPHVAARRILDLSHSLQVDVDLLAEMAKLDGRVLLRSPQQFQARVQLLASVLQMPEGELMRLIAQLPGLITRPTPALARNLPDIAALFKSRGLPLRDMIRKRPDLLLQAPGSLRNKIDGLAAALDLPPRKARDMIVTCPQLLRRSTASLNQRFKLIQQLFDSVPRNFLSELICSEPRVLCYSAATLKAKFSVLLSKYGSFQDDVVDMILVDPSVLIKAPPTASASSASSLSSFSSISSLSEEDEQDAAPNGHGGPAALEHRAPRSTVDLLLELAESLQLSLQQVLQLCATPAVGSGALDITRLQPADVTARMEALGAALGVSTEEARLAVSREPGLLALSSSEVEQRAQRLAQLLGPAASLQAAGASQVGLAPVLLLQNPGLLLQDVDVLEERRDLMIFTLGMPLQRVMALVLSCPQLLLQPGEEVLQRVRQLQELLGGVPAKLVSELASRDPRVLLLPLAQLQRAYEELAASFGSFREDALDVVLADPSILLKQGMGDSGQGSITGEARAGTGTGTGQAGGQQRAAAPWEVQPLGRAKGQGQRAADAADWGNSNTSRQARDVQAVGGLPEPGSGGPGERRSGRYKKPRKGQTGGEE